MPTTTNIYTLNQLIENVRQIATNHRQIHDFYYGDEWEYLTSGVTQTPSLRIVCPSVVRSSRTTQFNVDFSIYSNVLRTELDETEVESDLVLIAEDVIAQMRKDEYGWIVSDEGVNIDIRTEHTQKMFTVVTFTLQVLISKPDDRCTIPFDSDPIT